MSNWRFCEELPGWQAAHPSVEVNSCAGAAATVLRVGRPLAAPQGVPQHCSLRQGLHCPQQRVRAAWLPECWMRTWHAGSPAILAPVALCGSPDRTDEGKADAVVSSGDVVVEQAMCSFGLRLGAG